MIFSNFCRLPLPQFLVFLMLLGMSSAIAQDNSIVLIHADKSSGYGVAWGGPQNSPDLIVTALHLVAGKKTINVSWQGKTSTARVEKIYKPSDLALLKLNTPLGIKPLTVYSGEPPWDTNINFWEIPINALTPTKKTTILDGRTNLANISPQLENSPTGGLTNALCPDDGQYYPGMTTSVINFKEPNIRKAHSGSPLTYGDKILGMVDGGARLVGGKPCVWAIPAGDFFKLINQGTVPSGTMASCDSPGNSNSYMYSGIRADNPELSPEEVLQALQADAPINFSTNSGTQLELHLNYSMSFREVYETLYESEQTYLKGLFTTGQSVTLEDLLNMTVNFYVEENTGVSVMIPAQCTMSTSHDDYGTLNVTTSPGGLTKLSFYISPAETMEEGLKAMNAFKRFLITGDFFDEKQIPETKDLSGFNKYFTEQYKGGSKYTNGGTKTIFFANLIINDGDFLAVTLNASDWQNIAKDSNEKMYFYLMQVCAILSDFTIY
jgi:hypothetical protein